MNKDIDYAIRGLAEAKIAGIEARINSVAFWNSIHFAERVLKLPETPFSDTLDARNTNVYPA